MHTPISIELLRSIAMDILLFGGVLTMAVFFVLLVFVLRGVLKTMKLVNHLNEIFLQLNTAIVKVMDPLESFVAMLRLSMQKEMHNKSKSSKKVENKTTNKTKKKSSKTSQPTKKTNKTVVKKQLKKERVKKRA